MAGVTTGSDRNIYCSCNSFKTGLTFYSAPKIDMKLIKTIIYQNVEGLVNGEQGMGWKKKVNKK